ncbi:MAG: helix-turn-helix transcriptional regulator [Spirochaetales bacterium]|nr:helix-turn-helix transcriptional regulator [Spirochaetales bacterium]
MGDRKLLIAASQEAMGQTFKYWLLSFLKGRGKVNVATFAALKGETLSHTTLITLIYSEAEMLSINPLLANYRGESVAIWGDEVEEKFSPRFTHNMAMANCMPRLLELLSYEKSEPLCQCEVSYKPLTKREREVLDLLAQGNSIKEVAYTLEISKHTVVAHQRSLYLKTGARNMSQLVLYAALNTRSRPVSQPVGKG